MTPPPCIHRHCQSGVCLWQDARELGPLAASSSVSRQLCARGEQWMFFKVGLEAAQLVTINAWKGCSETLCNTGMPVLLSWSHQHRILTVLLCRPGCTFSPATRCCAALRRASWSAPRRTRWCGTRQAASGVPRRAADAGCPTPAVARRAWASLKWWKSRIGVPLQLLGKWLKCISRGKPCGVQQEATRPCKTDHPHLNALRRRGALPYALVAREATEQVPPIHMAQLQLHMLCTGADKGS